MKDYVTGNYDQSVPAFVFRQYYDAANKKLIPEKLETQYFGEKVVNPDDELMANTYSNKYSLLTRHEDNFLGDNYDDEYLNKRKNVVSSLESVIPVRSPHSAQKTKGRLRLHHVREQQRTKERRQKTRRAAAEKARRKTESAVNEGPDAEL